MAKRARKAVAKPGRPSKFTPELGGAICRLIQGGASITVACATQGIGRSTLDRWRAQGAARNAPFAAFVDELECAQGRAQVGMELNLAKAAQKDWHAAAWWLERRCPELYSTKQTMRVEKAPAEMSDAELEAAIAAHGYVRAPLVEGDV